MEKLQAALQKARARRETRPEESVARSTPARRAQSGSSRYRWEELKEIALSGQALTHHRIVTQVASEEAAPFDILRTKVLFQMRQNGWKRLAITSPMPKSGKTTAACNLALGLGRQSGLNSMLFDLILLFSHFLSLLLLPHSPFLFFRNSILFLFFSFLFTPFHLLPIFH